MACIWFLVTSPLNGFEPRAIFASDDKHLVMRVYECMEGLWGDRIHLIALPESEMYYWSVTQRSAKSGEIVDVSYHFHEDAVDEMAIALPETMTCTTLKHVISTFIYGFIGLKPTMTM